MSETESWRQLTQTSNNNTVKEGFLTKLEKHIVTKSIQTYFSCMHEILTEKLPDILETEWEAISYDYIKNYVAQLI